MNFISKEIQRYYFFPKYSSWIFVALVFVCCLIYNYDEILFLSPQSIHQWRQCDCLSITLNYCQDNNPFLEPSMHYLGYDGTGKTVSDFPLIYFTVGKVWQYFGQHEFIFRGINLLIFFIGLFTLFKLFETAFKDSILSILLTILFFTSPMLVFYANNFLMNVPALSFALIGFYFYYKYYDTSNSTYLILFTACYLFAGLLKITSMISFIAIVGLFAFEIVGLKWKHRDKIFVHPWKFLFLMLLVFGTQFLWYNYASHYNEQHNTGIFLIGFLPIWELGIEEIKITFEAIREHIKWDYFRKETQVFFLVCFFGSFFLFRKKLKAFFFLMIASSIGMLVYSTLFFQALKNHDYYTLNLLIVIPLTLLTFFTALKNAKPKFFNSIWLRIFLFAFLIHNIDFARRRIDSRYSETSWQNENYTKYVKAYENIRPYLNSIGIAKSDPVICLSDNSINISLYLMNQKGWTNFGIDFNPEKIQEKIALGAKYIFIHKPETYNEKSIQPFLKRKIGAFENVDIYEISD